MEAQNTFPGLCVWTVNTSSVASVQPTGLRGEAGGTSQSQGGGPAHVSCFPRSAVHERCWIENFGRQSYGSQPSTSCGAALAAGTSDHAAPGELTDPCIRRCWALGQPTRCSQPLGHPGLDSGPRLCSLWGRLKGALSSLLATWSLVGWGELDVGLGPSGGRFAPCPNSPELHRAWVWLPTNSWWPRDCHVLLG